MGMYYNVGARYEIVGRVLQGTTVIAYVLRDKVTGNLGTMEKAVVEQLALNKQIYNCSAQVYSGIVNLKGINCKLSKLPKYDINCNPIVDDVNQKKKIRADLKLVGKVQNGRVISDYMVVYLSDPNKVMKVPRDTVIKLAQEGRIINAKSQMNGSEVMLRGAAGVNLAQLKTYNV
jgi:hypothetical protein